MKTTNKGTPIVSAWLVPVYGKDGYEIVGINAVITGCPSCGHRHSHAVELTDDGGDTLMTKAGKLKPLAAPCSARLTGDSTAVKYCLDASDSKRRDILARLRANKAFLDRQAAKLKADAELACRLRQQNLQDGLREYELRIRRQVGR